MTQNENEITIEKWLKRSVNLLEIKGIRTARLDNLIILEHTLNIPKYKILAQLEMIIPADLIFVLKKKLILRYLGEPIAYITQKKEFYGRQFYIDNNVLIPRPDSEKIIDLTKYIINNLRNDANYQKSINLLDEDTTILDKSLKIVKESITKEKSYKDIYLADIGTGSGVLGVTMQLEIPNIVVDLIDISKNALKTALVNVNKFATKNLLIEDNLLENNETSYHILIANLPYVPLNYSTSNEIKFEPFSSIFALSNGIAIYEKLVQQIRDKSFKPLYIIIEKIPIQDNKILNIFNNIGYFPVFLSDFTIVFGRM